MARAARAAPPGPEPPRPVDVLLDAVALRFTDGYAAAAPTVTRALELLLTLDVTSGEARRWLWLTAGNAAGILAMELWDFPSWHTLTARNVQVARDAGALLQLRIALQFPVLVHIYRGELAAADPFIEEYRSIAEVTGPPAVALTAMMLAAWRGQEMLAAELIEAVVQEAASRGLGMLVNFAMMASSVLYNGLGRYSVACDHARQAFERDHLGFGSLVVPELAEAAARTGDVALVRAALDWLAERTRVTPTGWLLGMEALVRALVSDGETAERCYRDSIGQLGRTRARSQLARAHLLYGEWLRRERRRADARAQLRTAHGMLEAMGMAAFAERARRELLATGETVRKRSVQAAADNGEALTVQEALVARLARDGLSNPEIGARLYLSTRTVQYHLSKVFAKLGISSRNQLSRVLSDDQDTARPR